ncbi:CoA-transferase [Novosphingobium pentaromativorans US6-1]|uniref:Putative acyl-CoA transferase/carnitine dehydratase n=2 Tax=Novosphingobium pentaromativorans TaxID=205844 RepID=G6EAU0_9SPHN|nr:CoA-transferase [Novosphingobium pentaromativorans US6-1]EHJ61727.1 putative acyl-CoA transferase/carnitine dehydratase [Novosphingobium pentaromativorans US6-1]
MQDTPPNAAPSGDGVELRSPPLAGVRVLDLSRVLAGPWCTQCLADLGAEVLKVESPGDGDETRTWAPPYAGDMSAYFTCANRSKSSLVVDLKTQEGKDTILALAAQADVVIENFKTGSLERMGLGREDLRRINPRLIHCSISGYGRSGPQPDRAGYDFVIQAESGLMSITGEADGPPVKVGVAVSDIITGLYASQAILAALVEQRKTGQGRFLDVALFDCQLAALANIQASVLATGQTPRRFGNAHATVGPYQVVDAADGPFVIALGNSRQFDVFCRQLLDRPDIAEDDRFRTNGDRLTNREALNALIAPELLKRSSQEWLELFHRHGLPGGLVQTVDQALASEQVSGRGLVHRFNEEIAVVRYPVQVEGGLPDPSPPPHPGEGGEALAQEWLSGVNGISASVQEMEKG